MRSCIGPAPRRASTHDVRVTTLVTRAACAAAVIAVVIMSAALAMSARAAEEGWAVTSFDAQIAIQTDGYSGSPLATFSAMNMSRDLSAFSSQISTAIASTPGGKGSSGFSGGSSGGGGGGGGGSW